MSITQCMLEHQISKWKKGIYFKHCVRGEERLVGNKKFFMKRDVITSSVLTTPGVKKFMSSLLFKKKTKKKKQKQIKRSKRISSLFL